MWFPAHQWAPPHVCEAQSQPGLKSWQHKLELSLLTEQRRAKAQEWKLWLRCITSITETQSVCETEKRKFKFFLFLFISLWTCITLCYVEMEHHAYEQSYMCVYCYVASTSASVYLCWSSGLQDIVSDTTSLNYSLIHLVYMVITHTRTYPCLWYIVGTPDQNMYRGNHPSWWLYSTEKNK